VADLVAGLRGQSPAVVAVACLVTVAIVIGIRLLWVFPDAYVPRWLSRRRREREAPVA